MSDGQQDGEGHAIFVTFLRDDGSRDLYATGIRGFVDADGDFIIPYVDEMTAEEVGRIITYGLGEWEKRT